MLYRLSPARSEKICKKRKIQQDFRHISAMKWRYHSLIRNKVFNIRIGTVASLVCAVCFEIALRYFSVSLCFFVSVVIFVVCIMLIHLRKAHNTFSYVGASTLLFLILCISGALSLYQSEIPNAPNNFTLSKTLYFTLLYKSIRSLLDKILSDAQINY